VGLVAELSNFFASEVSVALKVFPPKVVDINTALAIRIFAGKGKDTSSFVGFLLIVLRIVNYEDGRLIKSCPSVGIRSIASRDDFFQSVFLKVQSKELSEI